MDRKSLRDREMLSLVSPDGEITAHPSRAYLEAFLDRDAGFWGDADFASLEWLLYRGDGACVLNPRLGRPALTFFYQEPAGFFLAYRAPGGDVSVPRTATPGQVVRSIGGEAKAFPAAAFVDRTLAREAIRAFPDRTPVVEWVNESALDFRLFA